MPTTMTAKSQVTIPKAVRDKAGIQPGDRVEVGLSSDGQITIDKVEKPLLEDPLETAITRIRERRIADKTRDPFFENMSTDEYMRFMRGDD
jgi:AbrB family looped-hinge helix DNA binding protein